MIEVSKDPSKRKFLEELVATGMAVGVALANPRTSYSANPAKKEQLQSNLDSSVQTEIDQLIANGDVYLNAGAA